jgi:hypothetical protein
MDKAAAVSAAASLTNESARQPFDSNMAVAVYDSVVLPPHPDHATLDVEAWDGYSHKKHWAVRVTRAQPATSAIHHGFILAPENSVPQFDRIVDEAGDAEAWRAAALSLFDCVSRQTGFIGQVETLALLRRSE